MPWWVQSFPRVGRMCPKVSDLRKKISHVISDISALSKVQLEITEELLWFCTPGDGSIYV